MAPVIKVWHDPMSATLHIKVEIPEVFAAVNFFALQDFERVFWDHNAPLSTRLFALTNFVRRTLEKP